MFKISYRGWLYYTFIQTCLFNYGLTQYLKKKFRPEGPYLPNFLRCTEFSLHNFVLPS